MTQEIECRFTWRPHCWNNAQAIVAIVRAVNADYRTRDELLSVLPQFSLLRLACALDALFTAGMLENNCGMLTVHPDMDILLEIMKNETPLRLPLSLEEAKVNGAGMQRALFARLGCTNAAGAQTLVFIKFNEVETNAQLG